MLIRNLLTPKRTLYTHETWNKKHALESISKSLAADLPAIEDQALLGAFIERERLGTTAIGHGVALPHIRSHHVRQPLGALLYSKKGIDFDSPDDAKVDLIFALVVPKEATEKHLHILAQLAEFFSQDSIRERLRETDNYEHLFEMACSLMVDTDEQM